MLSHNGASEAIASSGFWQCQVFESHPDSDINAKCDYFFPVLPW